MMHASERSRGPLAVFLGIALLVLIGLVVTGTALGRAQAAAPYLSRYVPHGNAAAAALPPGTPHAPAPATAATAAATPGAAGVDPARPSGVPVTRGDWMITKDYAAHGGLRPPPGNNQGAVDFAFYHNLHAFGADVVATHAGTVKLLRDDPTYGNLVYVLGPRWSTTYGHLQDFAVADGQAVQRGQVIGHMGATGVATGPHVDYQVWEAGQNRNPLDYCGCGMQGPDVPPQP